MGKFLDFLAESRSADLYHGTNIANASRILQDNVLTAQTPIHSTKIAQQYKGHTKTVSLTRNVQVGINFARASAAAHDTLPVVFVLDQSALYQALGKRMRPYDDLDSLDQTYGDADKPSSRSRGHNEREEVVFGNIANFAKYIKHIIIHIPDRTDADIPEDEQFITRRAAAAELRKYPVVATNPKTIVKDILGKQYTYREFMQLLQVKNGQV